MQYMMKNCEKHQKHQKRRTMMKIIENDDMVYNDEQWSNMDRFDSKTGGVVGEGVGSSHPAFANKMIFVAIPHDDDTALL